MYFILFIAIAVASYAVQASLKSKFSTYSKTPLSNGMTGAQVAEKNAARQWHQQRESNTNRRTTDRSLQSCHIDRQS